MRVTARRRAVAKVVAEACDYPNVYELHRRIAAVDSRISLATVYRTLRLLVDFGMIERHTFRGGRACYEPTPQVHRDHLIDIKTGRVIEFRSDEIERLQVEVSARLGYRLTGHRLELYGEPVQALEQASSPIAAPQSLRSARR
ncbi:MAG: transcriptional repressor [Hyphomicrobium sp.]